MEIKFLSYYYIASSTIILFISGWSKFFSNFDSLVVLMSRSGP